MPPTNDAPPSGEPVSTGDDDKLQQLLNDWDQPVESKDVLKALQADLKSTKAELSVLRERDKARTETEATQTYEKELSDFIVPTLKGDLEVDNDLVEWWIDREGRKRPELVDLFEKRNENRKAFEDAMKELVPEFKEYAEDKGLATKGLAAAVKLAKSGDTKPESEVDLSAMSDSEFAAYSNKIFLQAEKGELK